MIIVVHADLLKEEYQLLEPELMKQQEKQMKEIKVQYLKIVLHLLIVKVK